MRRAALASGRPGLGFNHTLLLPRSMGFKVWHTALQGVADFGPQALVVSLGLDTFEGDPILGFPMTPCILHTDAEGS